MQDTPRIAFQPPKPGGTGRSVALALLAHGLLLLALTWGIHWNSEPNNLSVSAELWSALPQEAAPPLQEPEPQAPPPTPALPPPEPVPVKAETKPTPPPPAKAAVQPDRADADIALQKEKAVREKKEREDKQLKDKELKAKAEKLKAEKVKEDKEREDKEREKKKLAEKAKAEEKTKQLAQDKKRAEELAKKDAKNKAEAEAENFRKKIRDENMRRLPGLEGAPGSEDSKGTALKASGPSASYLGRIAARIKPNITFNGDVDGNPKAEVEVRVNLEGRILSRKLTQSSGNKAWDEAVLKAIDKTETLPRETDGQIPSVIPMGFRPKD